MGDDILGGLIRQAPIGAGLPGFAGMEVRVNPYMADDQMLIMPNGEAVMGNAKYAEFQRQIAKRMDDRMWGAIMGGGEAIETTIEPPADLVAMRESELWGAF